MFGRSSDTLLLCEILWDYLGLIVWFSAADRIWFECFDDYCSSCLSLLWFIWFESFWSTAAGLRDDDYSAGGTGSYYRNSYARMFCFYKDVNFCDWGLLVLWILFPDSMTFSEGCLCLLSSIP